MASNKLRNHPAVKRSGDGIMVQLSAIKAKAGWNVRTQGEDLEAHIEAIKESILGGSKLPPLQVYVEDGGKAQEGVITIIDGHCRTEAYKRAVKAGAEIEYVRVDEFEGNDADRVAFMFTSAQGRPLSQYEQALAFKRLRGYNWTPDQIAQRIGKTRPYVDSMLLLANADSEVQELVKSGDVSPNAAVTVVRKSGGQAAKILKGKLAAKRAKPKKAAKKVRVTAADLDEVRVPKAFQEKLGMFFMSLGDFMGQELFGSLQSMVHMSDADLEGEQLPIDTAFLVSLVRLRNELVLIQG